MVPFLQSDFLFFLYFFFPFDISYDHLQSVKADTVYSPTKFKVRHNIRPWIRPSSSFSFIFLLQNCNPQDYKLIERTKASSSHPFLPQSPLNSLHLHLRHVFTRPHDLVNSSTFSSSHGRRRGWRTVPDVHANDEIRLLVQRLPGDLLQRSASGSSHWETDHHRRHSRRRTKVSWVSW